VAAFTGLAALASATCLAVTTAAKSGKEAQNTLTPVILLVSALAGTALLPGMRAASPVAAVPFAGQVLVARTAFDQTNDGVAGPLAATIASSLLLTWLLLGVTALMLTDEDILFRGPDAATKGLTRPSRRDRPTVVEGVVPLVAGLAALWYVQGLTPDDLALAIPLQQAAAVLVPLAVVAWWQRVDLRRTFSLPWRATPTRGGTCWPLVAALAGAALVGAGLFLIGAATLLAVRGTAFSDEARQLTERLLALMRERPTWLVWCLIALLPAVCEELLFRGWALAAFAGQPRSPGRTAWAILAQAACFAIFHLLPERMPQTFLLGAVLGWITVTTGSLLPAIVGHLAHNSMAVLLVSLTDGLSALPPTGETGDAVVSPGIPTWAVVAAFGSVILGGLLLVGSRRRDRSE
jgi:sodium transport system permease protein